MISVSKWDYFKLLVVIGRASLRQKARPPVSYGDIYVSLISYSSHSNIPRGFIAFIVEWFSQKYTVSLKHLQLQILRSADLLSV